MSKMRKSDAESSCVRGEAARFFHSAAVLDFDLHTDNRLDYLNKPGARPKKSDKDMNVAGIAESDIDAADSAKCKK